MSTPDEMPTLNKHRNGLDEYRQLAHRCIPTCPCRRVEQLSSISAVFQSRGDGAWGMTMSMWSPQSRILHPKTENPYRNPKLMRSIIGKVRNPGMEAAVPKMEVPEWRKCFKNCTTMLPSVASGEQKLRRNTGYAGIGRMPKRAEINTTHRAVAPTFVVQLLPFFQKCRCQDRNRHHGVSAAAGSGREVSLGPGKVLLDDVVH